MAFIGMGEKRLCIKQSKGSAERILSFVTYRCYLSTPPSAEEVILFRISSIHRYYA
jgi:hypothetical protein